MAFQIRSKLLQAFYDAIIQTFTDVLFFDLHTYKSCRKSDLDSLKVYTQEKGFRVGCKYEQLWLSHIYENNSYVFTPTVHTTLRNSEIILLILCYVFDHFFIVAVAKKWKISKQTSGNRKA